jgi:hypothetical protein
VGTYSVLKPDEVDRLEARLGRVYRLLRKQSKKLPAIEAELPFQTEGNRIVKSTAEPIRHYAPGLYAIAEARRHADLAEKREELRHAEASVNAAPNNAGGWQDPGRAHMQAQVAELAA